MLISPPPMLLERDAKRLKVIMETGNFDGGEPVNECNGDKIIRQTDSVARRIALFWYA